MVALELPSQYGYVLLSAVSTFFVGSWLGMRVVGFRKAAKISYPYEYASYEQIQTAPPARAQALHKFNCAQRGHQNFNENHVTALGAMLIAGLKYPIVAASLGAVWTINRVIYAWGYTTDKKDGKGRYYGIAWMLVQYILIGYAGKAAWDVAMA
ncbi:membrane-associated proteins in eicosanoid and glutathione metabolism [Lojkania enalia]|uniref:Membrane-associated proteins in eicosanoid and glutathione metabolism n=1 Tax=Lojkania enalia TaxID=147567 RepID=A0A9P4NBQ2_9PLEO|nr:membrane-associated proteins in eicosanoid and glutathione metabolism [Didymosphaeria enalia]